MNNNIVKFDDVQKYIVQIKGKDVILDYAVAELYGVQTKEINQAVRNNPRKFPKGYVFQIDNKELAVKIFDHKSSKKSCHAKGLHRERTLYASHYSKG